MCRRAYLDYRDVFCALNRRTFDVFVRIYEDGPIEKDKIGHEKVVKELIEGGFVMKIGHGRDVLYKTTRIGEEIFEKVAELVDGWHGIAPQQDTIWKSGRVSWWLERLNGLITLLFYKNRELSELYELLMNVNYFTRCRWGLRECLCP